MKRKVSIVILTTLLTLTIPFSKVFAISSNGGSVNTQMNNNMGSIIDSTTVDGWHSSGGYWRFNYNDWSSSFSVNDSDVANYFSGTSKTFNENLVISRTLPQSVKDFIRVYGKDKVGIKLTVGKDGSILNNAVSYTLTDTTINLSFRPILRYNRYNMWEYHNSTIWNSMTKKVHTPEVTLGFGENYVSVRNGVVGMLLTPSIMRSAYKASDGKLRFTSSETTSLGDGSTTIAKNEYALNDFFSGGSSGIYFRYPINIQFYDISISASSKVSNVEYVNGSTYWVKAGDEFTIETKGISSGNDSLVRPTQNTIKIDSNGSTQLIDMRKTASSNTVQQSGTNGGNFVNFNSNKISSNTESNGTFNANINVTIDGDKDLTISSMSRLNNFQNGNWDTSKLYKTSDYTSEISVKSDSKAPTVSGYPDSSKWNNSNVSFTLNANDERSGMKSIVLYENGNQVATGTTSINYTASKEGQTTYKIVATDNVGNSFNKEFVVKIDKTKPTVTYNPNGKSWTNKDITVNISVADNLSGIKSWKYAVSTDNGATWGAWVTGTGKSTNVVISTEGISKIKTEIVDNSGNSNTVISNPYYIDKTAPTGDVKYDFNDETLDMNITVDNIVETGSGLDRVWVEYYPKDNPTKIIVQDLIINGNKATGSKNIYDELGNVDMVGLVVKATDKVGNEGVLGQHEVDMFNITATIERVLEPHDPIFKSGEKGILKIKLYGGVDKVKITFPTELTSLDDSLDVDFNLEPKKTDNIDYEFYIPIDTLNKGYMVQVKGYKNGREKVVYPTFTVTGNILDDLRTKILFDRKN